MMNPYKFRKMVFLYLICVTIVIVFVVSTPFVQSMVSQDKNFNYAMSIVLEHEGGLTNSPNDPGGITNWGISLRYIKSIHLDINGDGVEDREDIIELTKTEADKIYLKDWWEKYHYNKIVDKQLAAKIMDSSVNMGASRCHKLIKQAINQLISEDEDIPVNGDLDKETIEIINNIDAPLLHQALRDEEHQFYHDIIIRNPHLVVFKNGWDKRAEW
jgi:lysozyme family protein